MSVCVYMYMTCISEEFNLLSAELSKRFDVKDVNWDTTFCQVYMYCIIIYGDIVYSTEYDWYVCPGVFVLMT